MKDSKLKKVNIYIAYPTVAKKKSIHRAKDYITKVNNEHTNVGRTIRSFDDRCKNYKRDFNKDVEFEEIVTIDPEGSEQLVNSILASVKREFNTEGDSRQWFKTTDRKRIKEIIFEEVTKAGIGYEFIDDDLVQLDRRT